MAVYLAYAIKERWIRRWPARKIVWPMAKNCDLGDLAAAYAFGLSRNHPFRDGNKRIAFLAAGLFLELNGFDLRPEPLTAVETFFGLAAGTITEKEVAVWIRQN